jgi:DNA-binding GntR family transcriptional regulator
MEALRSRDPDRAEAAIRHHIANARANLVKTETEPGLVAMKQGSADG